jgi:hypothetical protein
MQPVLAYTLDQMQTFFYLVLVLMGIAVIVLTCAIAGFGGLPRVWRAGQRLTAVLVAGGLLLSTPFLLGAFWVLFAAAAGGQR